MTQSNVLSVQQAIGQQYSLVTDQGSLTVLVAQASTAPASNQAAWGWNPISGSDSGAGTPSDPLLTQAEAVRRLGGIPGVGVVLRPLGSSADDMPRLSEPRSGNTRIGLWNILSEPTPASPLQGFCPIYHLAGLDGEPWLIKTAGNGVPSFFEGYSCQAAIWESSLPQSGAVGTSILGFPGPTTGADLGLLSDIQPGQQKILVSSLGAGPVAVGSRLLILSNGLIGNQYVILSITAVGDSGPFVLTLDRPVQYLLKVADPTLVQPMLNFVQHVKFDGGGCTFTGPGQSNVGISAGYDIEVSNIWFADTAGTPQGGGGIAVLLDTGTWKAKLKNLRTKPEASFASTNVGIFLAAVESVVVSDCDMSGFAITGQQHNFCYDVKNVRNTHRGNIDGVQVSGPQSKAILFDRVICDVNGSNWGSLEGTDITLRDCTGSGNARGPFLGTFSGGVCVRPKVFGGRFDFNDVGLQLDSTCVDPEVRGTAIVNNAGTNLITSAEGGTYDVDCSSTFAALTITAITNTNPIQVTVNGALTVGASGSTAQVVIQGATGPGAGGVNGFHSATTTATPGVFTIPVAGTGAASGGTVTQVTGNGVQNASDGRYLRLTLRGGFGSGLPFNNVGSTTDISNLEMESTIGGGSGTSTPGCVFITSGKVSITNAKWIVDNPGGTQLVAVSAGAALDLLGRHNVSGAQAGAAIGVNATAGSTTYVGADVDFSAITVGFRFFGGASGATFTRQLPTVGQPNAQSTGPDIAVSTGTVTLTDAQLGQPVLRLIGTLTGAQSIVFPNELGAWWLDDSRVVYGGQTLTLASGSGGTSITANGGLRQVMTFGSNVIVRST